MIAIAATRRAPAKRLPTVAASHRPQCVSAPQPDGVVMFPVPILSATDDDVYYQNDAAISVDMMFLYDEIT